MVLSDTNTSIPQELQGVLWSKSVDSLDLDRDAPYITHQILAYGDTPDFTWLLRTYGEKKVQDTFIQHPYKDYTKKRFHFITQYWLDLEEHQLDPTFYVKTIPRGSHTRS